jgi:hypothetical protein
MNEALMIELNENLKKLWALRKHQSLLALKKREWKIIKDE